MIFFVIMSTTKFHANIREIFPSQTIKSIGFRKPYERLQGQRMKYLQRFMEIKEQKIRLSTRVNGIGLCLCLWGDEALLTVAARLLGCTT